MQALIPQLFSLCGYAQSVAAKLALDCAAGAEAFAAADVRQALTCEAARESLRWLLLDLPLRFDGVAADDRHLKSWRQAKALGELRSLAEAYVFGEAIETWLARDAAERLSWMRLGATPPARWLAQLERQLPCLPLLPAMSAADYAAAASVCLHEDVPTWGGEPCEVGALNVACDCVQPQLARGELARARLLARLLQLGRWLSGAVKLDADAVVIGDAALARVDTARGPLLHVAAIDTQRRISRYRIVPPTLWHCHKRGVICQTLQALSDRGNRERIEWLRQLALIDPCVAVDLRFDENEFIRDSGNA